MSTPRPFFDTAREIRRGQFLEDCADSLQEVVAFVSEHGKAAELVIKIKIKPASKGNGAFVVADDIKASLPKLPAGETIFFGTPDNNLVPNDPRQKPLDLKVADSAATGTAATLKTA